MRRTRRLPELHFVPVLVPLLALSLAVSTPAAYAQRGQNPPVDLELRDQFDVPAVDAKSRAIVRAAKAFLDGLSPELRARAVLPFDDNAQRANWSNLPETFVQRAGVQLGDLNEQQEAALFTLMGEILSPAGVRNVDMQLVAEEALENREMFQREFYKASFLGEPAEDAPWMFQFGGHHLAINTTIFGPWVSFAPMLTGGQPTRITYRGEPVYIVEKEVEAAHALLDSLNAEQKARAVRGTRAINLLLGPGDDDVVLAPEGLRANELSEEQRGLLMALIDTRLDFLNDDDAAAKREQVVRDLDDTWFGWWGPEQPRGTAYFRVTAPSLVLEYAPQGRNPADHIHSMYREPDNDYGAAWIAVRPE